ncbi:MAG: 4-alpha-glucanotransferase [Alphaproteobacteria bacterium]|nr:4-alpha-glucanotransferase [Alphaproteobacteria bacterium]
MEKTEIEDFDTNLGLLADLYGIEYQSTPDMKVGMLKAMGVLERDFDYNTPNEQRFMENLIRIKELVRQKKDANFRQIVHHIPVLRENRDTTIEVSLPDGVSELKWNFWEDENPRKLYKGGVNIEDSEKLYSGEVSVKDLVSGTRETDRPSVHRIGDTVYRKYQFKFPFDVKHGYHDVEFSYVDKNGVEVACRSHLISAPEKCYDGFGIRDGKKAWGVPVQLYEQVSANNLGIGNYSDLAQIGHIIGKNGAGLLGVNPLHANRCDQPENASPYSPDSRMFFNHVYLDVTAIDEFKNSKEIQDYYNSPEFQKKLGRNRRKTSVDYTVSQELVDDILRLCYKEFKKNAKEHGMHHEEYNKYSVYCDEQDGILDKYATFRALSEHFSKMKPTPIDWTYWPDEYKDPNSFAVKKFMEDNEDEIEFYKYAQWHCEKQLREVKDVCLNSGMKIGLYMDMAVGASPKGFEAWFYKDLFIKGSAGATPDELSPTGQIWNVLGFNPSKLQDKGYEPYRRILEANMKFAGCIRIDHVLQLYRLYFHLDSEH